MWGLGFIGLRARVWGLGFGVLGVGGLGLGEGVGLSWDSGGRLG